MGDPGRRLQVCTKPGGRRGGIPPAFAAIATRPTGAKATSATSTPAGSSSAPSQPSSRAPE
eukprot:3341667-Lingulodinium_polyedra.AAC.1